MRYLFLYKFGTWRFPGLHDPIYNEYMKTKGVVDVVGRIVKEGLHTPNYIYLGRTITTCEKEYVTEESLKKIENIFREKGSNAWFDMPEKELMPEGAVCSCGCTEFKKETDIIDVWFYSCIDHSNSSLFL